MKPRKIVSRFCWVISTFSTMLCHPDTSLFEAAELVFQPSLYLLTDYRPTLSKRPYQYRHLDSVKLNGIKRILSDLLKSYSNLKQDDNLFTFHFSLFTSNFSLIPYLTTKFFPNSRYHPPDAPPSPCRSTRREFLRAPHRLYNRWWLNCRY